MTVANGKTYDVYVKSYGTWTKEPRLVLAELTLPIWPEVPTCELKVVLVNIGTDSHLGLVGALDAFPLDTEILVVQSIVVGEAETGPCLFWGRITGQLPSWNRDGQDVRLAARHITSCLGEFYILGSHGRAYGDYSIDGSPVESQQTHFTGMAAILNPDHYGNMTVAPYTPDEEACRLFGPEGHLSLCTSWTTKKFLEYLIYWACQASTDIAQDITWYWSALGEGDLVDTPADFAADGLSYLEAMHRILEQAGWRGKSETGGTGTAPEAAVKFWQIGKGAQKVVTLGYGGNVSTADNAQAAHLVFDASGIVTTPQVAGGPVIVEGTFRLYPAWRVADLDITEEGQPDYEPEYDDPDLWAKIYYQRYIADDPRASLFSAYTTVGRKWALNEMADYIAEEYGFQPVFSPGGIIGEGVGVWCMRSRPFIKPISRDAQGRPLDFKVEVSFDAGVTWGKLAAQPCPDEAAVIINVVDLATLKPPVDAEGVTTSDYENYWEAVCAENVASPPGLLRVRITACLADDSALEPSTALTVPAWAKVQRATEFPYDRRKQYAKRLRLATGASASRFVADGYGADTRNDQATLTTEANMLQAVTACIAIRGPVELFGTGHGLVPGDVVTEISGTGLSLAQGGGTEAVVYAEVVCVTLRALTSQSEEIVLEDVRMRMGPGSTRGTGRPEDRK